MKKSVVMSVLLGVSVRLFVPLSVLPVFDGLFRGGLPILGAAVRVAVLVLLSPFSSFRFRLLFCGRSLPAAVPVFLCGVIRFG